MRTDALLNTSTGDLEMGGYKSPFLVLCTFKTSDGEFDNYEIDITEESVSLESIKNGFFCTIPLIYSVNKIKLNVKYRYGNTEILYNTGYLEVKNSAGVTLASSDLQRYMKEMDDVAILGFVALTEGFFTMFNGESVDIFTGVSKDQNKDLILKSTKSNLYSAQTIGVGLIDFLNSDLSDTKLIYDVLESFGIDKMSVISMKVNNEVGEISMEVKENE